MTPPGRDPPLLRAASVVKRFGALLALDHVDIEIARSEKLVIIGPSGSGKSTLIRCLNGLVKPDAGTIAFEGRAIEMQSETEWRRLRRRVGMVFQDYSLFPHLTVLRNIALAPVRTGLCSRSEAGTEARRLLERVRLPDKADAYPVQLSGGQQQRVAIARALAMRPQLMLFDEPTSALDPEMIKDVLDLMAELAQDGMTMAVVTHEMGFARRIADRVIVMEGGRKVEEAPPEKLFTAPDDPRTRRLLASLI
jgi:ABC-type polar amino acid transport system ATPase subunit